MIPIKYILSVLLYILLLPISTPAGDGGAKGSSGKAGCYQWGSGRSGRSGSKGGGNGGRGSGIGGRSGAGASIFTNGNLLEWIGEQSIYGGIV